MYVLHVQTGRETAVANRLKEIGFKVFLPQAEQLYLRKKEWLTKTTVIFKGYVFVDMAYTAANYYKVIGIDNVIGLLKIGDMVAPINAVEESYIKLLAQPALISLINIDFDDDNNAFICDDGQKFLQNRLKKINKHKRTAVFEFEIGGNIHDITLSIKIKQAANN